MSAARTRPRKAPPKKRRPHPQRPKRSRRPGASARLAHFCSAHLRHTEGRWAGQPFVLDPWQVDVARDVFDTVDTNGLRVYREALIGISKGNGKTPFGGAIALYGLVADNEPGAECYVMAGSKEQARILFRGARAMVLASPYLRAVCKVYRDAIEVPESGGIFRVLSSDASLAHGYRPHIAVVDEVWVHKNPDLYEAMTSALHKRAQPLVIGLTTAGFNRKSLLWSILERAREADDPEFYLRWFGAPDGAALTDRAAWRAANPATWVTDAQLAAQLRRLPEPVFRRLHMNQWTTAELIWIPLDWWEAGAHGDGCKVDTHGVVIPPGSPVVIGVDSAPKKDSTAVIVDWRDDDGVHHWRTWIFKADRTMGYLDYAAVEDLLRQLCDTYDVERILVDPYNMIRSMIMLLEEGLPIEEFPQNDARMVQVSQNLFELVQEQRLVHGGHQVLREMCANAAAKETSRGWRLHKLSSGGPIDGMVAGGMAALVAEQDAQREGGNVHTLDDDELAEYADEELEPV